MRSVRPGAVVSDSYLKISLATVNEAGLIPLARTNDKRYDLQVHILPAIV